MTIIGSRHDNSFANCYTTWSDKTSFRVLHDEVIEWKPFSVLLAICARNSPLTDEFPAQRPVTRSFDVFFDLRLLSKQWWGWWFETPPRPLWRHCNGQSEPHKGYYLIQVSLARCITNRVILSSVLSMIWGVLCQRKVSRVMINNYIPRHLWGVITCLRSWYMLLSPCFSYVVY